MTKLNIADDGTLTLGSDDWLELKKDKTAPAFKIVVTTLKNFVEKGYSVRIVNDDTGTIDRSCDRMSELQDEVGQDFPLDNLT